MGDLTSSGVFKGPTMFLNIHLYDPEYGVEVAITIIAESFYSF